MDFSHLPKIVDNEYKDTSLTPKESNKLYSLLNQVISQYVDNYEKTQLDIATGYLNISGWSLVKNQFLRTDEVRILLGTEVNKKVQEEAIQESILKELDFDLIGDDPENTGYKSRRRDVQSFLTFLKAKNDDGSYKHHIKLLKSPFLHGKCYLFRNIGFVGSSNFTKAGLSGNTELNVVIDDQERLTDVYSWFDYFFKKTSNDYRDELIEILDDSIYGNRKYDPYIVFLKTIYESYKDQLDYLEPKGGENVALTGFQLEGVHKSLKVIHQYGGVMIADAVGLGKSYMGLSLFRSLLLESTKKEILKQGLIICPAQLKDNWENLKNAYGIPARIITQESISRNIPDGKFSVILIDESHNFRNKATGRFKNMETLLAHGGENIKIILLTATPINTGYMDIYYQLYLALGARDNALADRLNIADLETYFKEADKDDFKEVNKDNKESYTDISQVTDQLVISRSRAEIAYRQQKLNETFVLPNGEPIKFPTRTLQTIRYNVVDKEELYSCLKNSFPKYANKWKKKIESKNENASTLFYIIVSEIFEGKLSKQSEWRGLPYITHIYKKEPTEEEKSYPSSIVPLLLTIFFKRLEGSLHAFIKSIETQTKFYKAFLLIFQENKIFTTKVFRKFMDLLNTIEDTDAAEETDISNILQEIEEDVGSLQPFIPADYEPGTPAKIKNGVEAELSLLKNLLNFVQEIQDKRDGKLQRLNKFLQETLQITDENNPITQVKNNKIILFTFYKDTADYLYQKLLYAEDSNSTNTPHEKYIGNSIFPHVKIAKLTGEAPPNTRNKIIEQFAPASNVEDEEKRCKPEDEITLVISTDVISEGQNLQDAKYVINYDLHWNPVRMIQRAGRIDRLGSLHEEIKICNFFPEEGLEDILNLVQRITKRIDKIHNIIKLDAPVIMADRQIEEILEIEREDPDYLAKKEISLFKFESLDAKKLLLKHIQETGKERLSKIPAGIYTERLTSNTSGMAVVFEVTHPQKEHENGEEERKEQHDNDTTYMRWIFEPDSTPNILKPHLIINRPFVEQLLICSPNEKRAEGGDTPEEIYDRVVAIIRKYRDQEKIKEKTRKVTQQIIKGNDKYIKLIKDAERDRMVTRNITKRFKIYLNERQFKPLLNDDTLDTKTNILLNNIEKYNQEIEDNKHKIEVGEYLKQKKWGEFEQYLTEALYPYFDKHEIQPDFLEKTKRQNQQMSYRNRKFRLITVTRFYTQETLEEIGKQKTEQL